MPLYEYQCESCSHRFERIQKFTDPLPAACPSCGGTVRKLMSSPAIQFKGTGFYITDYAKKSSPESSGSKSGAGSDSGKSDSGGKSDRESKSDSGTKSDSGNKSDSGSKSTGDSSSSASTSAKASTDSGTKGTKKD